MFMYYTLHIHTYIILLATYMLYTHTHTHIYTSIYLNKSECVSHTPISWKTKLFAFYQPCLIFKMWLQKIFISTCLFRFTQNSSHTDSFLKLKQKQKGMLNCFVVHWMISISLDLSSRHTHKY